MPLAYIGLGSNIGARETLLKTSIEKLEAGNDMTVTKISPLYETKPVGGPPQPDYINAALEINTQLHPGQLLDRLHEIENDLGRERTVKWGPRTIDLDILLYGNEVVDNERLTIPHPLMHEREFALAPLSEIAPNVEHPILRKTIRELLNNLESSSG